MSNITHSGITNVLLVNLNTIAAPVPSAGAVPPLFHTTPSSDTTLARPNCQAQTGTGKYSFSLFSCDHEQDWQPYTVDPYPAICDDHTYILSIYYNEAALR